MASYLLLLTVHLLVHKPKSMECLYTVPGTRTDKKRAGAGTGLCWRRGERECSEFPLGWCTEEVLLNVTVFSNSKSPEKKAESHVFFAAACLGEAQETKRQHQSWAPDLLLLPSKGRHTRHSCGSSWYFVFYVPCFDLGVSVFSLGFAALVPAK